MGPYLAPGPLVNSARYEFQKKGVFVKHPDEYKQNMVTNSEEEKNFVIQQFNNSFGEFLYPTQRQLLKLDVVPVAEEQILQKSKLLSLSLPEPSSP